MLLGQKPSELVQEHELLMGQQHQVWKTKEFHLYQPSVATPTTDHAGSGQAMLSIGPALNAFFPERTLMQQVSGGLEVYEPGKAEHLFYKEYIPLPEGVPKDPDATEDRILDTIITGSGHSAWGPFTIRARVRAWDGLVSVIKDYSSSDQVTSISDNEGGHDRGRWLYRGYVYAGGHWVGRWRDTVTELQFCGYEGAFALRARR